MLGQLLGFGFPGYLSPLQRCPCCGQYYCAGLGFSNISSTQNAARLANEQMMANDRLLNIFADRVREQIAAEIRPHAIPNLLEELGE